AAISSCSTPPHWKQWRRYIYPLACRTGSTEAGCHRWRKRRPCPEKLDHSHIARDEYKPGVVFVDALRQIVGDAVCLVLPTLFRAALVAGLRPTTRFHLANRIHVVLHDVDLVGVGAIHQHDVRAAPVEYRDDVSNPRLFGLDELRSHRQRPEHGDLV